MKFGLFNQRQCLASRAFQWMTYSVLLAGTLGGAKSAHAATYTFTGNAAYQGDCNPNPGDSTNWDDPRNWGPPCAPAGPPTAADTAIIAGGAAVITHDVTVAGLTFSGGIIGGNDYSHSITVNSAFKWSGGTFVYNISYGSVAVICGPNCITTTTGTSGQSLTTNTFTNQGTLNWKGPSSISAHIDNSGSINLQNDGFFCGSVFNSGAIKKSVGTGFSDLDSFQSTGIIEVQTGTLRVVRDPNLPDSWCRDGSIIKGAGIFEWDQDRAGLWSGTVTNNGTFRLNGGVVGYTGNLLMNGTGKVDWQGGSFNSSDGGQLNFGAGITINSSEASAKSANAHMTVLGTLNWKGGAPITASDLTINGTFNALSAGNALNGSLIINSTFNTFAGGETLINAGHFANNGIVNVGGAGTIGILSFYAGDPSFFTNTGTINMDIGGTVAGTSYDQILARGDANSATGLNLGGTLQMSYINSFTPKVNNIFDVLHRTSDRAGFSGQFANLKIPPTGTLVLNPIYDRGFDLFLKAVTETVSINDIAVTEGNAGTTNATFTVTLAAPSPSTISINAIPGDGTARAPGDYTSGGVRLIFNPGETVKTFTVPVKGDLLNETDETFFVILSSPVNCLVSKGRGVGTILNDDEAPTISIDDVRIGEGNSGQRTAAFRLKLSAASGQVVRVSYATASGTATPGSDYVEVTPTQVAFTAGNLYAYARVLLNGDALNEPDETFYVNLSAAQNATIALSQAQGTILNDDSAPSITINDVSVTEGDGGTKTLNFAATLSKASGQTISVNFATADGTAKSSSDYVAQSGTLGFAPQETSKAISITLNGDTTVENDETLYIFLSAATNASIGKARGVGTITNDDASG